MRWINIKTIFIFILIILMIVAIYTNVFHNNKTDNKELAPMQEIKKNILVSNDIRIGIIEFDNMNPILSNNKNVQDISRLIFEPLFTVTQDFKLEECLGTEWSKLDDQTYIIKLRENVKWQDGNEFNASDVIFTIDMLKNKNNNSIYYYNVKDIKAVEEIDEYTLKIVLDEKIPYYEYNFIFPIVSSKNFNESNFLSENKNLKPAGTGKFYISDIQNNNILLKKNVNSWDNQVMQIDTISLNLYDSLSSAINAFKSGDIDIFTTANNDINEYLKNVSYNKAEYINRTYNYIALNYDNNILSNIEVRQAINSAIDKDDIIKNIYNDKYKRSNFPLDFGSYAYDNNNIIVGYDKNTAKKLLVDSGWKYYSKKWRKTVNYKYLKIELDIVVNKADKNKVKVANKIKEQLESVGIRIDVIQATQKQYNNYLKKKNYDILIASGTYSYSPSLNKYFKNSNLANYKNENILKILDEVENLTEENEIRKKYSEIMDIYNNDVPYISLYYDNSTMIYSSNLKGKIEPNSYNLFYNIGSWYREYTENK